MTGFFGLSPSVYLFGLRCKGTLLSKTVEDGYFLVISANGLLTAPHYAAFMKYATGQRHEGEAMYNLYGFHSMSMRCREEALRNARTRHLEGWPRAGRPVRSKRSRAGLAWGGVLTYLLHGARLTGQTAGWSEEQR